MRGLYWKEPGLFAGGSIMRKLLFAIPMAVLPLLMGCSHGYVGVGVHEDRGFDGRYYGHHEYAYRRPVVVQQRPVIVREHDFHRDGRWANDRW
jgi:hypothetical protein